MVAADWGVADCGPVTPFVGVVIGTPDGVVAGIVFELEIGFDAGLGSAEFALGSADDAFGNVDGFTMGLDVGLGFGFEFGLGAGAPVAVVAEGSVALGFTIGLELGLGLGFELGFGAGGCVPTDVPAPFEPAVVGPVVPLPPPLLCANVTALTEPSSSAVAIIRPN